MPSLSASGFPGESIVRVSGDAQSYINSDLEGTHFFPVVRLSEVNRRSTVPFRDSQGGLFGCSFVLRFPYPELSISACGVNFSWPL